MKKNTSGIREKLANFSHKIAEEGLAIGSSGNISARIGGSFFIKTSGISFENAKASDFIELKISNPSPGRSKRNPSREYRFHKACYDNRPEIRAVFHTHPLIATTLYSSGIKYKPLTLEFALYIGKGIAGIPYINPGTEKLAEAVGRAVASHDILILKKHGVVTVGRSLHEAYLKALIVEREAKAQLICRLFEKKAPYFTEEEVSSLSVL